MRISVECGGFTEAADACRTANQVAALVTGTLAGRLGGYAGMAGDDATSRDFAASYDAGAREAVAALVDLTHAFVGLGRLVDATGRNHAAAEAVAAGLPVGAYDGGGLDEDAFVRVSPADPPSALGRQEPSFGAVDRWILDHVEGFVWPGADVDVLRDAAATWRRTAAAVADLTDHLDVTARLLARQRSPEIPLALSAVESLSSLVVDTADQLMSLAEACEEYAVAVEEAHDRTRALLAEIGQMVVEGVAVSVLVAGISGGLGGGAAAGAALARIRTQAPRFHALLTGLRATAATGAARIRSARESLSTARAGLEKFARVPVRNERGVMRNPLGWGDELKKPGWLRGHEVPPGHALSKHVGKSVEDLLERCRITGLSASSSFPDELVAERAIARVLRSEQARIDDWLASGTERRLTLDADLRFPTGITVRGGTSLERTGVRVVLIPRQDMPRGWQILTAFPN